MRRIAPLLLLAVGCAGLRCMPTKIPNGIVRTRLGVFMLDDKPVKFLGINVYPLASRPLPKFICGRSYTDAEVRQTMDEVRALVPPPFVPVIRLNMFRNFIGPERDWSRYDLIFAEARARGIKIVATLDSHWGSCSGEGVRPPKWYCLGYRQPGKNGLPSQWEHVRDAARRYRDEPALLMWQIINEGQCDDAEALLAYAADLSSLLKHHDPNHLVSFGTMGDDRHRPGAEGSAYARLHQLPTIDVVESHEYPLEGAPPGTWLEAPLRNCLTVGDTYDKPCMIGEIGMTALTPEAKARRAELVTARIRELFRQGAQAVMIWSYRSGDWQKDIDPTDPLYDAIKKAPLD